MGGILILVLFVVYVVVAIWFVKGAQSVRNKVLLAVAFILIPTADAVYGRIRLKQMCEAEGGLHIYRVVEGVEGFYDPGTPPWEGWITQRGYSFVEGNGVGDKPARMSRDANGKIKVESNITPMSKYIYEYSLGKPGDIYYRIEQRIRVIETNEILSKATSIKYAGGWVERAIAGLYASRGFAGNCGPRTQEKEITTKTLKPINTVKEQAK